MFLTIADFEQFQPFFLITVQEVNYFILNCLLNEKSIKYTQ